MAGRPVIERFDVHSEFCERVESNLNALYGVAIRLTRDPTDAEDLVSDAVAKAWKSIESLEDWTRFRAWLFQIMRNHFNSSYRKEAAGPDFVPLEVGAHGEDSGDLASMLHAQSDAFLQWWADPEKEVADQMLGEQIRAAIDDLPEAFRVTILLVNVDGLRYDEAAEALGVPAGTVRSRMKRGRTLLQRALWEQACEVGLIEGSEVAK